MKDSWPKVRFTLIKPGFTIEKLKGEEKLVQKVLKNRKGTVLQKGLSYEFNGNTGVLSRIPVLFVEEETGQIFQVLSEFVEYL